MKSGTDDTAGSASRFPQEVRDEAVAAVGFESMLAPVVGPAFGVALHLTRNRADAEDLVQDAALLAFRAFGRFEPGSNFKAWFFRILINCFRSAYRKRQHEPGMVGLEDASELYLYRKSAAAGLQAVTEDPVGLILGRIDAEQIAAALQALPEEFRTVATLYFLEEFSYQEIAAILGIPIGTVRSRLHRGRCMLQKLLWRIAEEQGAAASPAGTPEAGKPG